MGTHGMSGKLVHINIKWEKLRVYHFFTGKSPRFFISLMFSLEAIGKYKLFPYFLYTPSGGHYSNYNYRHYFTYMK